MEGKKQKNRTERGQKEDEARQEKWGIGWDVCSSASRVQQDGCAAVYCKRNESRREAKEGKVRGKKKKKKKKTPKKTTPAV